MQEETRVSDRGVTPFSPLLEHAIELSAQWHDQTYRKSRWRDEAFQVPHDHSLEVPVVAHVAMVAMTLQRAGWDDATVAAALLHDVIEDRNRWNGSFSYEDLSLLMGSDVVDLVRAVSEEKYDTSGRPRSWRARKEDYLLQLRAAPDAAVAISVADKLHNLWTINESLATGVGMFARESNRRPLNGSPEEQLWLVTEVLGVAMGRSDARLEALRERLALEIDRFGRLTGAGGP